MELETAFYIIASGIVLLALSAGVSVLFGFFTRWGASEDN
jgi:uncharacterized membrane protein YphA (DoxX/SURF4 family)